MLYSETRRSIPSSGFIDDDFPNPPTDAIRVSPSDFSIAINLPSGSTYTFDGTKLDANGCALLVTTAPTSAFLLAQAQNVQLGILAAAYDTAIQAVVSFTTAGGVTKTYQTDAGSQDVLVKTLQRCQAANSVPAGFYWVATDNTQVPFTLSDLQGLDAAIFIQGWTAFQNLQTKKAAVRAATTVAAVRAVTW